jgi:site-specific recombinase XerD
MSNRETLILSEIVTSILKEMEKVHYSSETIQLFRRIYNRLEKRAESMNKIVFDEELAQTFISDSANQRTGIYCHSRFCLHSRCIQFLKSFTEKGAMDWSAYRKPKRSKLKVHVFTEAQKFFSRTMEEMQLKDNTVEGYDRIVFYFLNYCENKGYHSLSEIQTSDISTFLEELCQERYQPTSIGSHLPGLKLFLSLNNATKLLTNAILYRPQRKREIIPVLEEDEYKKFTEYLRAGTLSNRDTAICWIALETGLRAVDICNLKLNDVDWKNDCIHIVQQKTSKSFEIPLRPTYGNAMVGYILYDRPESDSPYLFLSTLAPFPPLSTHAGCYKILYNAFRNAGILKPGRICGTRLTRHNAASHMLRKGIPLHEISAVLGHSNPNSVNIYLTTDDQTLAECTLPLPLSPRKEVGHNE